MTLLETEFTRLVGVEHPVMQDGMGPFRTTKLAGATSKARGLGSVSCLGLLPPSH